MLETSAEPPQGHEESAIPKATTDPAGRVGTPISRNAEPLARCRLIEKKVVSPDQQRAAADYLDERYGVSQRRICRVMGRSCSSLRYRRTRRADEPALNREIKQLARRHPRYGYRRVHALISNGFRGYNSFGEVMPGPKSCGFGQVVPYGMAWNRGGLALS